MLAFAGFAAPSGSAATQQAPYCLAGQSPRFAFGFADLKASLGDTMGEPLTCEYGDPASGDTLQQTTTGLAFYRQSTNTPTFTNGNRHWALMSPTGLVAWTGDSVDPPPTAAPAGSLPTSAFNPNTFTLRLERVASGLREPIGLFNAGDGSGRLFVIEKGGTIRTVQGGTAQSPPFLNVSSLVSTGTEQGLLGLAFHPRYRENGLFFINYTDRAGNTNVVRYRVSPDGATADPASATTILRQSQPFANHNGGNLVFGPDGYLYIGLGDGGGGGDPRGNSQNGQTWLGKMLRIDVDRGDPYAVPSDNPFVGNKSFLPEVWAYGLRNPWRYSFDRATGELYIADVGQGAMEEIDVQPAGQGGQNYGWNRLEGTRCFSPASGCDRSGLTDPVAEYDHGSGCSVTGGYVYRGRQFPQLSGGYFYGDFCSGIIWGLWRDASGAWQNQKLLDSRLQISAFGEDEAGEVYLASMSEGVVYRLAATTR